MLFIAESLKRKQLRKLALGIRESLGLRNTLYFPVMLMLEIVMPQIFDGFYYEIVTEKELGKKKHADTDVVNRCIRIREDVYYGAESGNGRDRMTVAHEIAHYILLVICGVKFARSYNNTPAKPYEDPEWHAKALAGELLCAAHLIKGFTVDNVAHECGVSYPAAKYQLSKI